MEEIKELDKSIKRLEKAIKIKKNKRLELVAEMHLNEQQKEIANNLRREIEGINGYVIRTSGRYWICTKENAGCLHRMLFGAEVDSIKPFLKDYKL